MPMSAQVRGASTSPRRTTKRAHGRGDEFRHQRLRGRRTGRSPRCVASMRAAGANGYLFASDFWNGSYTCAAQVLLISSSAGATMTAKVCISGRTRIGRIACFCASLIPVSICSSTSFRASASSEPLPSSVCCMNWRAPGPAIALVLQLVQTAAQFRQRFQVGAHQRGIACPWPPPACATPANSRPTGPMRLVQAGRVDLRIEAGIGRQLRRRAAQHGFLEPGDDAPLGLAQLRIVQRRIVPRGFLVDRRQQLGDRRRLRVAQAVHRLHGAVEAFQVGDGHALHEFLPLARVVGLVHGRPGFSRSAPDCLPASGRRVDAVFSTQSALCSSRLAASRNAPCDELFPGLRA